jgi:hypothetical protein
MQKTLCDGRSVMTNASLLRSFIVLMLDVAALSAKANGMDLLSTPSLILLMSLIMLAWLLSCSSTWQGGEALDNTE